MRVKAREAELRLDNAHTFRTITLTSYYEQHHHQPVMLIGKFWALFHDDDVNVRAIGELWLELQTTGSGKAENFEPFPNTEFVPTELCERYGPVPLVRFLIDRVLLLSTYKPQKQ